MLLFSKKFRIKQYHMSIIFTTYQGEMVFLNRVEAWKHNLTIHYVLVTSIGTVTTTSEVGHRNVTSHKEIDLTLSSHTIHTSRRSTSSQKSIDFLRLSHYRMRPSLHSVDSEFGHNIWVCVKDIHNMFNFTSLVGECLVNFAANKTIRLKNKNDTTWFNQLNLYWQVAGPCNKGIL